MSAVLTHVRRHEHLSPECFAKRCSRDGCSVSLERAPSPHLVVDMDCEALGLTNETHCDYLFVSHAHRRVCVVPIEFKRGSLSATHLVGQLQAGANYANQWLPHIAGFEFVPILAHKGLRSAENRRLRKARVTFRKRKVSPELIRCGAQIAARLSA